MKKRRRENRWRLEVDSDRDYPAGVASAPKSGRYDRKIDPVVDEPAIALVPEDEQQRLWTGRRQERLVEHDECGNTPIGKERRVGDGNQAHEHLGLPGHRGAGDTLGGDLATLGVDRQAPVGALDAVVGHQCRGAGYHRR